MNPGVIWDILIYAAPILLAALGGVLSERSGVINIGLEGLMLVGAFAAAAAAAASHNPYVGLLAAALAATALGGIFALFGVVLRRDQVIVGTTLNFLALGLTGVLFRAWTYSDSSALTARPLPALAGKFNAATLLALALVPAIQWLLFRTRLGVTLRAAGERPEAAAAAGTAVNRLRVLACLACGALCGLGGAALSIGISDNFAEEMTSSRGFVALAVVVFGRWTPVGALLAAVLFAAADVGQSRLQASGSFHVPYPVALALPYVLTLVALALRGARSRPPAALGEPFEQG